MNVCRRGGQLGPKIGPNATNFWHTNATCKESTYLLRCCFHVWRMPSYQSFAVKWKSNQILSFDIFLNEFSATVHVYSVQVLVTLGFNSKILF